MIVHAGWLICSAGEVLENAVLVTEGDRVSAVFTEEEWKNTDCRPEGEELDFCGSIVFPGFVNAHMHQYGLLSHGIPQAGKVTDFKTFLENYWWPYIENRIRKEHVLVTTKASAAEMLRSGITSFCDILEAPYTEEDTLKAQGDLIESMGMRGIVGLESSGRISEENGEACLRQNVEAARYFSEKQGLVRGSVCTHTTFTCTDAFIGRAAEYAKKENCMLQFHLSESRYEPRWLMERTGELPAGLYDRVKALGPDTLATQCVKLAEEEIRLLKESRTKTVHMPVSNCEVGGGIAPVPHMLEEGIHVALGTDGYINDFFTVMKEAFHIHKAALESTETMPARQVFRMATEYGAEALQLLDCGVLRPGSMADFVVYKERQPTPVTRENIFDQLVVHGVRENVTDVVINGKQVMKDGCLLTIDEEKCRKEMRQCAADFWKDVR